MLARSVTRQNRFVLFCHSRLFLSSKKVSHSDPASQQHCQPIEKSRLIRIDTLLLTLQAQTRLVSDSFLVWSSVPVGHTHTRKDGIRPGTQFQQAWGQSKKRRMNWGGFCNMRDYRPQRIIHVIIPSASILINNGVEKGTSCSHGDVYCHLVVARRNRSAYG